MSTPTNPSDKPLPPEVLIPDASLYPNAVKLKERQQLMNYNAHNEPGRFYHDYMRRMRIFNG